MGLEIGAVLHFLGLGSVFAMLGVLLAGWMAWRIVEKAGVPGWAGFGAILMTLTAVGTIVPLVLLWVFAFMRWPRDERFVTYRYLPHGEAQPHALPGTVGLAPPPLLPTVRRGWRLSGRIAGRRLFIAFDGSAPSYLLTGAPAGGSTELSVPDPSVGQPHARLYSVEGRLGLQDLGTRGGTFIDGAQLLPEHGPRDITNSRRIRLGAVELALSRA